MLSIFLSVVSCVCSVISMIALISISSSCRRLRDKFKASPKYDDENDNYRVVPYDLEKKE